MKASRASFLVGGLAAFPCVLFAAASLWWTLASAGGGGPWPADQVTLAEAIATRNNAEALRLIALGANPNQRSRVRDGMLTNGYGVTVLPVEAAVGAQRADSLQLLIDRGAVIDASMATTLRCYERARPEGGVRAILERVSSGEIDCTGVRLPTDRDPRPRT
jgi:hypothetical protein